MSRPKVLMFIDWYLPGFRAGGPTRSCANLIDHLSSDISFYIVTRNCDYQSNSVYEGIETGEWIERKSGEKVMYLDEPYLTQERLHKISDSQNFEAVYIHGLFSSNFSIKTIRYFKKLETRLIVAPRGMLRKGALALKPWKKLPYLYLARILGWYRTIIFHATDEQESSDIRKWFGKDADILIAPNLPKKGLTRQVKKKKPSGGLDLIFAGRIAPEKNLLYAIEVLSRLKSKGVRLQVYGAEYDKEYGQRCKNLAAGLTNGNLIEFHEPVRPEMMTKVLQENHALFLPTKGENFGHIILESFMASRPVVISNETPWKELDSEGVGYDIDLDHPELFVKVLEQLLEMDDKEFQEMCSKAADKFKSFSSDQELIRASKTLFSDSEGQN